MLAQLMSVQGVIAREVGDVRLAMRAAIAYDPHDVWQVPMPFDGPATEGPIRVGFTREGEHAEDRLVAEERARQRAQRLHPEAQVHLLAADGDLGDPGNQAATLGLSAFTNFTDALGAVGTTTTIRPQSGLV